VDEEVGRYDQVLGIRPYVSCPVCLNTCTDVKSKWEQHTPPPQVTECTLSLPAPSEEGLPSSLETYETAVGRARKAQDTPVAHKMVKVYQQHRRRVRDAGGHLFLEEQETRFEERVYKWDGRGTGEEVVVPSTIKPEGADV
jgi:hypothetical protein